MRERLVSDAGGAEVLPLRRPAAPRRPHSRRWLYAAAALAATLALAVLIRGQLAGSPGPEIAERHTSPETPPIPTPREETLAPVRDGIQAPLPERIAEGSPSAPHRVAEVPPTSERVAEVSPPAPEQVDEMTPPTPDRAAPASPDAIAAATDEELLLALGLEAFGAETSELEDLAIIEQLEFVELLEQMAAGERRG